VCEPESIALHSFPRDDWDRLTEHGASICKCMELTIFTAGIDALRKIVQELFIEVSSGKIRVQRLRIYAYEPCAQAAPDHLPGQFVGRNLPKRKEWLQPSVGELAFAIGADVSQEQVAKCNGLHSLGHRLVAYTFHSALVVCIGAWPGQWYWNKRQSGSGSLHCNQRMPGAVHRHSIKGRVDGGNESTNFQTGLLPQDV